MRTDGREQTAELKMRHYDYTHTLNGRLCRWVSFISKRCVHKTRLNAILPRHSVCMSQYICLCRTRSSAFSRTDRERQKKSKLRLTLWHFCKHFGGELVHGSNASNIRNDLANLANCLLVIQVHRRLPFIAKESARTHTHKTRRCNKFVIAAHIKKLLSFQLPYLFCIFMSAALFLRPNEWLQPQPKHL